MKNAVGRKIRLSLENLLRDDFEEALLHVSIALDITSKREHPTERQVGKRYKRFLKNQTNMNIITGVMFVGLPIAGLHINFNHPDIPNNRSAALEDIIYTAIRCSLAHNGELPPNMQIVKEGIVAPERPGNPLTLPHSLIWGLNMVVVGAHVNAAESLGDDGRDFDITLKRFKWRVGACWGKRAQLHQDLLELRKELDQQLQPAPLVTPPKP